MMLFRQRRQEPPAMTLEGVLGPNGRLDDAAGMDVAAPDALCVAADGRLLFSSGRQIMALDAWGGTPAPWAAFDATVTALCAGPGGLVAAGLAGGRAMVLDASGSPIEGWSLPTGRAACVVDCAFRSKEELLLLDCGLDAGDDFLALAAWDDTARGQVLALRRDGTAETLAAGLRCPMGLCIDAAGTMLVSLLERASVVNLSGGVRQAGYPGYLGRLRRTPSGFALACLSRRDPLIEFLKTETAFVAEMKANIAPRHWIAPRATPAPSHDLPIELGAARLFGEVKPWAPSFSYGLVVETDGALMPAASAHSRANGSRHAICDVCVWNGDLLAVSKAGSEILNLGAAS